MGRAGIDLTTLGLQDDPLTPLSYSHTTSDFLKSSTPTARNVSLALLHLGLFNDDGQDTPSYSIGVRYARAKQIFKIFKLHISERGHAQHGEQTVIGVHDRSSPTIVPPVEDGGHVTVVDLNDESVPGHS
ncbi:hypothetical protein EYF80_038441 [Liparis tanakae]|uniref:Uncharacterized protein n=1 Tax=Liparis tanakae TaxID=230148 RepID=A0A4Z2GEM7_9TELE|nr:hypothetical protein EYF80_038441 [Liparis tanakae]